MTTHHADKIHMTYLYEILSGSRIGETVEIEHSIKEPAKIEITLDNETVKVKRLIATSAPFHLKGDCWAKTLYAKTKNDP